jgi:hypothetical protein
MKYSLRLEPKYYRLVSYLLFNHQSKTVHKEDKAKKKIIKWKEEWELYVSELNEIKGRVQIDVKIRDSAVFSYAFNVLR